MATASIKECIKHFVNALRDENGALFVGAGFSKLSGFVDWKELIRDTALELGLDVDSETDLIAIAQYHINERLGNRSVINQLIIEQFVKQAEITDNHRIVSELPINTFWTTNYDNLLENALSFAGKTADVKRVSENICITIPRRDAVIYKMHGDILIANDAVLTKEDYETYELNRGAFSIVLQADLISKTFLFLGFSFEDPNLSYILARIKNLLGTRNSRNHYCFFKKEPDSSAPEIVRKQQLKLNDLNRYGISAVLIDDYSEITTVLSHISKLYKRSLIFISGAAEIFEEFGPEEEAISLIHDLSKTIVSRGKKIISGFGYNVGSAVISGALEYIFSTKYRKLDEYIKLMPFPTRLSGEKGSPADVVQIKKLRNKKYRDIMLSEAGLIVFMFGNKTGKDGIALSNGMYDEFLISKEKGLKPIPIGATGYMAKKIWEEVMANFDEYYKNYPSIKEPLTIIGDNRASKKQIIDNTYLIIDILNKGYDN